MPAATQHSEIVNCVCLSTPLLVGDGVRRSRARGHSREAMSEHEHSSDMRGMRAGSVGVDSGNDSGI